MNSIPGKKNNGFSKYRYVRVSAENFTTGLWDWDGKEGAGHLLTQDETFLKQLALWQQQINDSDPFQKLSAADKENRQKGALKIAMHIKSLYPHWRIVTSHHDNLQGTRDAQGNLIIEEQMTLQNLEQESSLAENILLA